VEEMYLFMSSAIGGCLAQEYMILEKLEKITR
jgi:hypothetical protein